MNQSPAFSRKQLAVIGAILIGAALVFLLTSNNQTTPEDNGSRPSQSQITTNESGENQGQSQVVYEGFSDLAKYGFTSFQMQGVRYSLYQFAPNASKFTVAVQSIKAPANNRDNPQSIVPITFNIRIDESIYQAKVDKYDDLTTVRVYLTDPENQNKQVFDSQPVDARKLDASQSAPGE